MDDTVTVEITYSPQPYDIGTIREMPADEARLLIREGRARMHYPEPPTAAIVQPPPTITAPGRRARSTSQTATDPISE